MHSETVPQSDPQTPAGDAALVRRLQAGEAAAFDQLVREYGPRMLAVIRRYLPCEQDAHDALQNAFVSVFKAIGGFQGEARLETWLHRIAVNAALLVIRTQKRRHERSIEDFLPNFVADGHREAPGPAWRIVARPEGIDQDTKDLVRRCIDELPDSFRAILLLRDLEQRSTEEVAGLLEISSANVKTRLHRARQALRELLDGHFGPSTR